jgi:formylglycine-generating enzyme required for sulfatase activity
LLVIGQQKITWQKDGKEMALIPAGTFEMGDHHDNMGNALPVHAVELDAFYMDVHEVTVGQFKQFVNETSYGYDNWNLKGAAEHSPGDEYPMAHVTWTAATAYAKWAGKRLPTEAEWEYAARGGLVGKRYPRVDKINHDDTNYSHIGGKDKWDFQTAPVGSFAANGYGLYDMAGNVNEWCADWYGENYYSSSPAKNPPGPDTGIYRVLRGGNWDSRTYNLRVAYRGFNDPDSRYGYGGFRCVSGSP